MNGKVIEKSVRILKTSENGVSAVKAFQLAKSEGLIIVSNKKTNRLLCKNRYRIGLTLGWATVKDVWPIHTGTMTAYTKPNQQLRATVEYTDLNSGLTWIFEVPAELRSLKNTLLAIEYPNYDLEVDSKKKRVIVTPYENQIIPVINFPSESGLYETDPITAIPINGNSKYNENTRRLYRIDHRVGPVIRGYYVSEPSHHSIYDVHIGDLNPSIHLGVLVEENEVK